MTRRFEEAEEFLKEVAGSFPKSWLALIVQACVYLARGGAVEAILNIEEAYTILYEQSEYNEPQDNVFAGLFNLCRLRAGSAAGEYVPDVAMEKVKSAGGSDSWAVHEVRHAAGEVPGDYEGWDPGQFDSHIPYWTPLQLALGFIGLEEKESAIAVLTRAVNEGDPLTAWLHLLPLLDPLRDDPAFQVLIKRMNLC